MPDVTVVIATRDRRERLLGTLDRLAALPDAPRLVVVDNGSADGSADAVRGWQRRHPAVDAELVDLAENRGAAARTVGVQAARTPYVAFADDDSGWMPGALTRAAGHLDRHPRLGLVAAAVLVGPPGERRLDPVSVAMAASPLVPARALPGPPVLGFMACGAVVRRRAYLAVGGFSPVLFFLGEERLLAFDLAGAGWDLAYAADVEAVHEPAHRGADPARQALVLRNDLLVDWMRRPPAVALRSSGALLARALRDPVARSGLAGALRRGPAALLHRRRLPAGVEQQIRQLAAADPPDRSGKARRWTQRT
jgi:GT2 family glycosyltransferase